MSQFIKFYFTSSVLNMFRTLIHPLSGACDFSIVSPQWLCVLVSMCVGVSVWLVGVVSVWQAEACWLGWYSCGRLKPAGWGGIHVVGFSLPHGYHPNQPHRNSNTHRNKNTNQCGDTIEKSQAPDDGCINVRNMLSTEEVK